MVNEKIKTRDDYKDVGSVVPDEEYKRFIYSFLSWLAKPSEYQSIIDARKWRIAIRGLSAEMKEGGLRRVKDSIARLERQKDSEPVYKSIADTKEEAAEFMEKTLDEISYNFLTQKEEPLRSLFCRNYLAPMLLAGIRGGLNYIWWRAEAYGFSVPPLSQDNKPNAFPYRSIEEMTEDDRRAFLWVVEDTYYVQAEAIFNLNMKRKASKEELDEKENSGYYILYSKDGYSKEEIFKRVCSKDYPEAEAEKDYLNTWIYETERFLPIVLHRQSEALYYALKFVGSEYKDYLKSLNVEEDFNYAAKAYDFNYNEIMK